MVRGILAIAIAMVLCVALGLVGWLSIHSVNTTPVLYFFGGSVAPVIGLLWNNIKTGKTKDAVDSVKTTVAEIAHNTNGALTQRIKDAVNDAMKDIVKDQINPPDVKP